MYPFFTHSPFYPMRFFTRLLTFCTLPAILALGSCSKSPEAAAQEVCDCMGKATQSKSPDEILSNSSKCHELVAKYQGKFSAEDQAKFGQKTAGCMLGSMGMGSAR